VSTGRRRLSSPLLRSRLGSRREAADRPKASNGYCRQQLTDAPVRICSVEGVDDGSGFEQSWRRICHAMNETRSVQAREAWVPGGNESTPDHGLEPAPIPREWILEGEPVTRWRMLAGSSDDRAFTVMWDCTASCFNWYYDADETIFVLEGSVIITDPQGHRQTLRPTDSYLFPGGSRYHWNVPVYVRKVAFIHMPLPPTLRYARRFYRSLKGWLRGGKHGGQASGLGSPLGGRQP
jgi:uncharacterized protein